MLKNFAYMIKISPKVKKIEFKDRFKLIVLEDFLERNNFIELQKNFPSDKYFKNINIFAHTLTNNESNFYEFLNKNETWKKFIEKIDSEEFIEDIIEIFNIKYVYSCNSSYKKFLPFFKKVKLDLTFNKSKKGSYSEPHTDVTRKIVSIVYFFTDDNWKKEDGGLVKLFKPIKKEDEENWRNKIIKENELELIKTIFPKPNSLYGFKKTKNSYHGVSKVNCDNNKSRNVLMINLSYAENKDIPHNNDSLIEKVFRKIIKLIK
jgi:Rps23 Pro-64 3,4-dihydroxylase Tpa1-like proline 4-hydroxylase